MNNKKGLHCIDVGTGEIALVFLHYFGGSANSWSKVIADLSNTFRCIAIDLPGFGDSQGESKKLSVSNCAREVAQLIKALALKQYVLIGHSMGGKIALSLASLQPFGLTSLVLVAPSPPTPEPMDDEERKQLLNAYGDRFALETQLNNITAQSLTNGGMENAIADNLKVSYASWHWWVQLGSREDISPQTSTVKVPILVISGQYDKKLSTRFLHDEFEKYFDFVRFEEIKEAGHLLPIEAPAAVVKLIREYVHLNNVTKKDTISKQKKYSFDV